eukprot:3934353-Rhodomonas_salina.6
MSGKSKWRTIIRGVQEEIIVQFNHVGSTLPSLPAVMFRLGDRLSGVFANNLPPLCRLSDERASSQPDFGSKNIDVEKVASLYDRVGANMMRAFRAMFALIA